MTWGSPTPSIFTRDSSPGYFFQIPYKMQLKSWSKMLLSSKKYIFPAKFLSFPHFWQRHLILPFPPLYFFSLCCGIAFLLLPICFYSFPSLLCNFFLPMGYRYFLPQRICFIV